MQLSDVDPLWLDRLDVGLDDLPSALLDSLVPGASPPHVPAASEHTAPQSPKAAAVPATASGTAAAVAASACTCRQSAGATVPVGTVVPGAHMMAFAPHPAYTASVQMKASGVAAVDIEQYVPRTLLPVEPALQAQVLARRREQLERFRAKKRNRHLKKTIRYASRKAYAEVRPRIKGRFARTDEVAAMRAAGVLPPAS